MDEQKENATLNEIGFLFNALRNEPSTNNKRKMIEGFKDQESLRNIFKCAYTSGYNYGISKKTLSPVEDVSGQVYNLAYFLKELKLFRDRNVTGNAALEKLAILQGKAQNFNFDKILMGIVSKDLKCGVSVDTIDKVYKDLNLRIPIMKASQEGRKEDFEKNIGSPYIVQKKEDGERVIATINGISSTKEGNLSDNVTLTSSNNNNITTTALNVFKEKLFLAVKLSKITTDCVIDGEFVICNKNGETASRTDGTKIMAKIRNGSATNEDADKVRYKIWDTINRNDYYNGMSKEQYQSRMEKAKSIKMDQVEFVHTEIHNTYEEVKKTASKFITEFGWEGAVVKGNNPFKNGRPNFQIKIKNDGEGRSKEIDLRIEGYYVHKDDEMKAGGFLLSTAENTENGIPKVYFFAGSGMVDSTGEKFDENNILDRKVVIQKGNKELVGKIVTCNFFRKPEFYPISSGGTGNIVLLNLTLNRVRDDKIAANEITEFTGNEKINFKEVLNCGLNTTAQVLIDRKNSKNAVMEKERLNLGVTKPPIFKTENGRM